MNDYCPQDQCKLKNLSRRKFIYQSTGAMTVPAFISQLSLNGCAQAGFGRSSDRVLVIVQLSGGNDGLNTVIPYGDDAYGRNRFSLRIPENNILKLDDHHGLHPQMSGLHKLYKEGDLAIIQGVGYPNPNRSHFASMDIWHTARTNAPDDKNTYGRTGWLGRTFDHDATDKQLPALHLGNDRQPLALVGSKIRIPTVQSIDHFKLQFSADSAASQLISEVTQAPRPQASSLLQFAQQTTVSALDASDEIQSATRQYSPKAKYPRYELSQKLLNVAKMIHAGFGTQVYYLTLGGFDTHASQKDAHASLLRELSGSISAFMQDLKAHGHGKKVALMCFSEFGRRIKENGSRGTDHGVAGPVLVAGEKVRGGLHGNHPSLTETDEGDLIHHTDFRGVYAQLLDNWLKRKSENYLGQSFEGPRFL